MHRLMFAEGSRIVPAPSWAEVAVPDVRMTWRNEGIPRKTCGESQRLMSAQEALGEKCSF